MKSHSRHIIIIFVCVLAGNQNTSFMGQIVELIVANESESLSILDRELSDRSPLYKIQKN